MRDLRQSLLIVAHCLLAVFALSLPALGQSSALRYERPTPRVVEFGEQRSQTLRRVAIVGDVERPGVYQTTAKRLVAETVLTAAGSKTPPGYTFDVYHSGLTRTNSPVWVANTVPLTNGDVIVASVPQTKLTERSRNQIYVAVIGLLPDPVVIRIPESDRSLPGLFSRLHQPASATVSATVNGAKSTELLKNGDVITVGSEMIDRSALIGCDSILQPQSLDAAPEAPKTTTEWSPPVTLPSASELPPLVTPSLGEVLPQPEAIATLKPAVESRQEAPPVSRMETVEPISTTIPAAFVAKADDEKPRESRRETEVFVPRGRAQRSGVQAIAVDPDAEVRNLVILIALGTLGVGIALLWVASERRLKSVAAPEPVELKPAVVAEPAPLPPQVVEQATATEQPRIVEAPKPVERPKVVEKDDLGELIRGELPVQDEPVVLPSRVALHGKAVGQKRLVIHPPQSLAGPHFGEAARSAEKVSTARETTPVSSAPAGVTSSAPVRPAKEIEGLLDRVLLAMQREGRP